MLQELSDHELEMVTGASNGYGVGNVTVNLYVTINETNYSIIYAPINIYNSTISHSSIGNGNTYTQHIS